MEEELISKKELLEMTGISYGQLYRWKRKNLIPEEWFVRKSTFTGQETFFPRRQMLARVEQIKSMKEGASLDDLAGVFTPVPGDILLTAGEAVERGVVSGEVMELYRRLRPGAEQFDFSALLALYIFGRAIESGQVAAEEGTGLLGLLAKDAAVTGGTVFIARKLGVAFCLFAAGRAVFDDGTRVVFEAKTEACAEELRLKLL